MTQRLIEPLRQRHDDLRPRVAGIAEAARDIPDLDSHDRRAVVSETIEFILGDLRRHAEAEERWLYPELAVQLRHPLATAGMAFDHKLIREQAKELSALDVNDAPSVQAVLFRLHTLLDAHFRREEEVYLPLLDYEGKAARVAEIADAMARYERGEGEVADRPDVDLGAKEFPEKGWPVEKLAFLLRYAVQAPSSHNSQPWLFKLREDAVELYADRTRALPVTDHDDRELVISCGAALYGLRTAIRHFGYGELVGLLPDAHDSDLLARIELADPRPPTRAESLLFWAIARRRTNRRPFAERPVPQELLVELEQAARDEGATLCVIDAEQRGELADLIAEADRRQFADPRFRRELASWIHGNRSLAGDGMPAHSLELPFSARSPLVVRTFDVGKGAAAHDRKIADGSPVLAVLTTSGDTPRDWLAAGQALDHVLLRAAQEGVSASFLNQPIEVEELRASVASLVGGGVPQIVLRLGYGPEEVRRTPRRPLADVVALLEEETN